MMKFSRITDGYWGERLTMNATSALYHQWDQLVASGCIDNFRIAAGQKDGFREGFFFADSDAYKWLEAASRSLAVIADEKLEGMMDELISLLEAVQMEDGYIYTYNQVHFPGQRWVNLQIEHEFYCLGHLIESGVSHAAFKEDSRLLGIARKAADLLVKDFMEASPLFTDGHEEVEIALLRLYRHTAEQKYLELAKRLLERRGRIRLFPLQVWRQFKHFQQRDHLVRSRREAYLAVHPEYASIKLPAGNPSHHLPRAAFRQKVSQLSGKYFQQHTPLRKQTIPVGHSVRFAYLETAASMLAGETGDAALLATQQQTWQHMVSRRMYVTGGLGSLPFIEGFGNDYELDPQAAYAETCAALGSMFWNLELAQLTAEPCYADLFEWQLYNAASVGMGFDGRSYLYNNPMTCLTGEITRQGWYYCPCCPSNLSRAWASLGQTILQQNGNGLQLFQYISSETALDAAGESILTIKSGLPWEGRVAIEFRLTHPTQYRLSLRIPSWTDDYKLSINDQAVDLQSTPGKSVLQETACGYNPTQSRNLEIDRLWQPGDRVILDLAMPVRLYRQHPRIRGCGGMLALGRGPLIYCLESVDNPSVDLATVQVDLHSLRAEMDDRLFNGIMKIHALSRAGKPLIFIPYAYWGNRGASAMNVFFRG